MGSRTSSPNILKKSRIPKEVMDLIGKIEEKKTKQIHELNQIYIQKNITEKVRTEYRKVLRYLFGQRLFDALFTEYMREKRVQYILFTNYFSKNILEIRSKKFFFIRIK